MTAKPLDRMRRNLIASIVAGTFASSSLGAQARGAMIRRREDQRRKKREEIVTLLPTAEEGQLDAVLAILRPVEGHSPIRRMTVKAKMLNGTQYDCDVIETTDPKTHKKTYETKECR